MSASNESIKDNLESRSQDVPVRGISKATHRLISVEKDPAPPPNTDIYYKRSRVDLQAMPTRAYLDNTVVPILLQGMKVLAQERPPDPIAYLAAFLLRNKDNYESAQYENRALLGTSIVPDLVP